MNETEANREPQRRAALLVAAGAGVLIAIGSLMPWLTATAPLVGTLSRSGVDLGSDGTTLLIGGILVAVVGSVLSFGVTSTKFDQPAAIIGVFAGLGAVWVAWSDKTEINHRVASIGSDLVTANVGAGLWLCVAGGALLAVSMLVLLVTRKEPPTAPEPPPIPQHG